MGTSTLDWHSQRKLVILYFEKNLPILTIEPKFTDIVNNPIEGMGWGISAFHENYIVEVNNDRAYFNIDVYSRERKLIRNPIFKTSHFRCCENCYFPEYENGSMINYESTQYIFCQLEELSKVLNFEMEIYIAENPSFNFYSKEELLKDLEEFRLSREKLEKKNDTIFGKIMLTSLAIFVVLPVITYYYICEKIEKFLKK